MVKSNLENGTPILVFKVDMYVKSSDFAKAITNNFYNKSEGFDNKLTKTQAKEILYRELFFHGLSGQYEDGFFEASFEQGEVYNSIYSEAREWVGVNYPYLNH